MSYPDNPDNPGSDKNPANPGSDKRKPDLPRINNITNACNNIPQDQ